MTTRVKIENVEHGVAYKVNVAVFEQHMGGEKNDVVYERHELAPGESVEVTLYGTRGVTVVEQHSGE